MELLIYSEINVPRLRYVASVLWPSSISWKITASQEELILHNGPSIQYGGKAKIVPQSFHIPESGFLRARGSDALDPECIYVEGLPVLFPAVGADIPGDLFASVFFWISRYEEYAAGPRDAHGRYESASSHAARKGYLAIPVVDAWRLRITDRLLPGASAIHPGFELKWTVDIDHVAAFRGRSVLRQSGAWFRDLAQFRWSALLDRIMVLAGFRKDPFDQFERLKDLGRDSGGSTLFFWHVGDAGPYDRVVPWNEPISRRCINQSLEAGIGLHPSYRSAEEDGVLAEEKKRLETLTGQNILQSRQHYLRLSFPATYRALLQAGIREDWSMGYHDQAGFRAGTALPFPWFDLLNDEVTDLIVIPFAAMDVSLRVYMGLSAKETLEQLREIALVCRLYRVPMTLIWHNSSFYAAHGWRGWEDMPEQVIAALGLPGRTKAGGQMQPT